MLQFPVCNPVGPFTTTVLSVARPHKYLLRVCSQLWSCVRQGTPVHTLRCHRVLFHHRGPNLERVRRQKRVAHYGE